MCVLSIAMACVAVCPAHALADSQINSTSKPVRILVWDERQPKQQPTYEHFLGNAIADALKTSAGLELRSVALDDPDQGITDDLLDHTDVIIWWGHVRNRDVKPDVGKRIVDRIVAGKLSLIALHSAHWSQPFVQAMWERTREDVMAAIPEKDRAAAKIEYRYPILYIPPRRNAPITPYVSHEAIPGGGDSIVVHMPNCCFPAYRADGKPSHVTTLRPDHPIAAGIPKEFEIPQTEMYDEPFHVPAPDEVIFEEKWDAGEHFRSGSLWKVGKGMVFYFRPGHEIYPVYKQEIPLKILENAARYLASQLPG